MFVVVVVDDDIDDEDELKPPLANAASTAAFVLDVESSINEFFDERKPFFTTGCWLTIVGDGV